MPYHADFEWQKRAMISFQIVATSAFGLADNPVSKPNYPISHTTRWRVLSRWSGVPEIKEGPVVVRTALRNGAPIQMGAIRNFSLEPGLGGDTHPRLRKLLDLGSPKDPDVADHVRRVLPTTLIEI
jgi:hypothetical protein